MSAAATPAQERTAGYRDVLGVGEFRVLWLTHAQSRLGDQLARVAIAILVFSRTSSPLLTSLVYALTLLPPLVSAPLLSGLADRYARRSVLVVVDLCRCGLVGLMALPVVPLAGMAVLLVLSALHPSVGVAVVLWAATGALASYLMLALAEFTVAIPDHRRARAVGPLGAGLQAAQGLGIVLAGALASRVAPSTAVVLCGAAGSVCALLLARARSSSLAADPVEAP